MFYILTLITIKEIRNIFLKMLQEHETKEERMFTKLKKFVLDLISGHQVSPKLRLDLTLEKQALRNLKESFDFT